MPAPYRMSPKLIPPTVDSARVIRDACRSTRIADPDFIRENFSLSLLEAFAQAESVFRELTGKIQCSAIKRLVTCSKMGYTDSMMRDEAAYSVRVCTAAGSGWHGGKSSCVADVLHELLGMIGIPTQCTGRKLVCNDHIVMADASLGYVMMRLHNSTREKYWSAFDSGRWDRLMSQGTDVVALADTEPIPIGARNVRVFVPDCMKKTRFQDEVRVMGLSELPAILSRHS